MGGAFCGKWFSAFAKVGHFWRTTTEMNYYQVFF